MDHTNSIFYQYQLLNKIYCKTNNVVILTNTTQLTENINSWEIGKLNNEKVQYINKNFIAISNENSLKQLKEKPNMELVKNISELIRNNKDKINIVENDLCEIFNNTNTILQECISTKSKTQACIEMYNITYGYDWIFKIEQIWINF